MCASMCVCVCACESTKTLNIRRVVAKETRVKVEPQEVPLEEVEVGSLVGMEQLPIKEEKFKEEVKEEMMEDQVTAAAIETSSELTAALESIG